MKAVNDDWDKLRSLGIKLHQARDRAAALGTLDPEETVLPIYDDAVVEEMLLAAANRLADRLGLVLLRVEIEDGQPSMLLSFGTTAEEAKERAVAYCQHVQDEVELD